MSTNGKENNYNIIRFIAALMVIYGHMYVLLGMQAPRLFCNEINAIGFKILMIMSGYMITKSYLSDSSLINYMIKRCFRIFPALIFYTVIMTLIIGPFFTTYGVKDYYANSITWAYLKNIFLQPTYMLTGLFENNIYPYAVNGSLWALPVEFSLYIVTCVVLRLFSKEKNQKIIWIVMAIVVILLQIVHLEFYPSKYFVLFGTDWVSALNIYPYFLIGGFFSVVNLKKYCNLQLASLMLLVGVSLSFNKMWIMEFLLMLVMPYFIISLGEAVNPIFSKCFRNIDLSYGMFLWGFPVQQALIYIIYVKNNIVLSANKYFVLSTVVTLLFAVVTWYCVEKPISKVMKRLLKKNNE